MADLPDYTIRESRRAKWVRINVLPGGGVEVVVPAGFPHREVPTLLAARRDWLDRALARAHHREEQRPDAHGALPERIRLPALDREWAMVLRESERPGARQGAGGELRVHAPHQKGARDALCRWLGRTARAELGPWTRTLAGGLGVDPPRVSIRAQATRWGSCSSRGRLSLNRNLLFLEPEVVRYLLVHELAHTVHMDHSPSFWSLVACWEPAYRDLDRRLRDSGDRVPLWALPDRLLPSGFFDFEGTQGLRAV